MNKRKDKVIEQFVECVRDEWSITCPVGDLERLVKILGGELEIVDDVFCRQGEVFKTIDDKFVIRATEWRTRFVVAEQLGHLFLHMGFYYRPEQWVEQEIEKTSQYSAEESIQAMHFAQCLLMPTERLVDLIDEQEGPEVDLSEIADYFGVPDNQVFYRARDLGLVYRPIDQ